jgi:Tfp pilus assembly protein PilO
MKGSSNRLIAAMLAVVVLAATFWVLALSPKREEASKLGKAVDRAEAALAQDRQALVVAEAARADFSDDYRQLVTLGKAVPGEDDAAALIVQLQAIAKRADIRFQEFALEGSGEDAEATPAAPVGGTEPAPPTEVAASLLPLGAEVGPAGLATMPYTLRFTGRFFHVADFIAGLDKLVDAKSATVAVDGRLMTINGFALTSTPSHPFPNLAATFSLTTFVTPPTQGVTAGATPVGPLTTGTPASMTTEATP